MKVVEDFESRPHKAVSFVVERGREIQEWNEQKLPKVLPGYSGGRLLGTSTKEKGREEGEVEEESGERRIRNEIAQEVVVQALRRRQARLMVPRRPHKDQLGKVSCEAGILIKSKMKKRREAGETRTRWQHSGMKTKNWRLFWKEEGWKEAICSWRSCQRYRSEWCRNACHKAKG